MLSQNPFNLKVVIIGDGAVGKTSILSCYTTGNFPKDYVPTVFENKVVSMQIGSTTQKVSLWDTAGQEDFDRIRALFYPDSDAFIVCFSAVDVNSAYNVKERWYPELQVYAPTTPFVLLATKIDLRDDPDTIKHLQAQGTSPITYEQGQALAKDVGAAIYCECSAAKLQGVSEPFTAAGRLAAEFYQKKQATKIAPPKSTTPVNSNPGSKINEENPSNTTTTTHTAASTTSSPNPAASTTNSAPDQAKSRNDRACCEVM